MSFGCGSYVCFTSSPDGHHDEPLIESIHNTVTEQQFDAACVMPLCRQYMVVTTRTDCTVHESVSS